MIAQLQKPNGTTVFSHQEKEEVLWVAFKDSLGCSNFTSMAFNLDFFLENNTGLTSLEEPFTREEIDSIVKQLPNDKTPGPDGFNDEFIKKCWSFIKEDFYELCFAFQESSVCLQSINDSFITLIPKTKGAQQVGDFRPISLLNCSIKLITKLLANRLQTVLLQLVHRN